MEWALPANDALTDRDDQQRTGMNILKEDVASIVTALSHYTVAAGRIWRVSRKRETTVYLTGHDSPVICKCVGLACVVLVEFPVHFSNTGEHQT
jgi:hypothetical protein